jgi:hypothetical protein
MVNLVIALKNQVTQMIQQIELLRNQVKLLTNPVQLLTNPVGAAQTKKTVPTVAKTKALAAGVCAAQQNEYDTNAGPNLMIASRSGDALWVQTLLSVPDVQTYNNYTEKHSSLQRACCPLYTVASKGHAGIEEKLIAAGSNVNLAKTTDGASPILIATQHGHALVVQQLIVSRCNVDLALTTNGATAILIAAHNGQAAVVEKLIVAHCNVNIPLIDGSTALSLATQNGHTRIVTMIQNCLHPCTVCKKYGHDPTGYWINAENKLKAAAKMKSDAEAILKSKKSQKKTYVASSAAKESDASSCNCVSLKCYRACADT